MLNWTTPLEKKGAGHVTIGKKKIKNQINANS